MSEIEEKNLPLKGIKVLDIAVMYASPFTATLLSDFGAEVIKVEHPSGDSLRNIGKKKDGVGLWFKQVNRNKKSVTIDLGKPEGQALLKELVKDADVVVENFRPGTLERWNLGWDVLSEINPRLVLMRLSAYGQTGPYRNKPGFGTLTEAMSGFANLVGFADNSPMLPPLALTDMITSYCGAMAVMLALYERDVQGSGKGQYIDINLLEPIFHILGPQVIEYDQLGVIAKRFGNRSPSSAPRNVYKTKDDRYIAMSGSTQATASRIMNTVDPELIKDPRFIDNPSRVVNNDALDKIIADWCAERTQAEAIEAFYANDATVAPVLDIAQIYEDEHFRARGIIKDVPDEDFGTVKMPNVCVSLSRTPGRIVKAAPKLGADNEEILVKKLGKTEEEIQELISKGIIKAF